MKRGLLIDIVEIIALNLLIFMTTESFGQQLFDPNFDAKVVHPSYTMKHPKVLFDEAHFNFHTTEGRYKPFVDLIMNDGYQVTPNKEKFQIKVLKDYDILVIANAQDSSGTDMPAFTDEECDAVQSWVKSGGSLLLVADHMPWGGAASNLSLKFGVEMKSVFTIDTLNYDQELGNLFGDAGRGCIVFTRSKGFLADHSIIQGRDDKERINRVITFSGQSIKGPEESVSFIKLSQNAIDIQRSGEKISAAGRAQGIALKFDKGRVVVLGEAAMLSAQVVGKEKIQIGMNRTGIDNKQLALNIMHWLSKLIN